MTTATVLPFHASPTPPLAPECAPALDMETCAVAAGNDFDTLRDRGRELIAKGAYREAATTYRRAADVATSAGDSERADEALCGWGAAETELGNGAEIMPELREILLSSKDDHNYCLAAYTLARAHELQGQIKKALFYARLFRDRAKYVERDGLRGLAQNLMGNLLVADGRANKAATCYRTALRHPEGMEPSWKAAMETNLGYCLLAGAAHTSNKSNRARMREGLHLIYRGIRTFRRKNSVQYSMLPHLDLCFAHLELKRPAYARRHGERALVLAEQYDDTTTIKNCLYLLGQVALLEGDRETAHQSFDELERRFYPDRPGLADRLASIDLLKLVNLRA